MSPWSDLQPLLAIQEDLDRERAAALRGHGKNLADLAYANAYDGPHPEALAVIRKALDATGSLDFQYTPYGGGTVARRLVAESLRASHGAAYRYRDIVLTPGAMAALNIVFRALKRPGKQDEVVVVTPCWLDYPVYLQNLGLVARFAPVVPSTLRLDLNAIEAALTANTRAVVLSQPANPSGLIYDERELAALATLLRAQPEPPLLISDECHRNVLFAPEHFVPPTAHYERTCIVYSLGKSLLMQGQRFGYVAVSPTDPEREQLSQQLEQLTRIMGFCTPTSLMQLAVGGLLPLTPPLERFQARREKLLQAFEATGIHCQASQATFFLYPRVPAGGDTPFASRLAREGVLVLPSAVFHHQDHFRVCLTATDAMVGRAIDVLLRLQRTGWN